MRITFNKKLNYGDEKGFTLVEILVALLVSSIVMIAITASVIQIFTYNLVNQNKIVAIRNTDTAGVWLVKDFQSADSLNLPVSITLSPGDGQILTIEQPVASLPNRIIEYTIDASGNLLRGIDGVNAVVGSNMTSLAYSAGSMAVANQIQISSVVGTGTPIIRAYSIMSRISNFGLDVLTGYLPNAFVGVPYEETLFAGYGTEPYSWEVVIDSLPAWATLDPITGTITGTPVIEAPPVSFTVQVTDSADVPALAIRRLSIKVLLPIEITTDELPMGEANIPYNEALAATGGTGIYYWSLALGSLPLPLGLTLSDDGIITGIPTAPSTYPITVQVLDSDGDPVTKFFTVVINTPPEITTVSPLINGSPGALYDETLQVAFGVSPFTWSIISGNLPPPLTLNSGGVITGTPFDAGTYNFTVQVIDSLGGTNSKPLSITIVGVLGVSTNSLSNGGVGLPYNHNLVASPGVAPYIWSIISGSLPPTLSLTEAGNISGTPTTAGTYDFIVQVTDSDSNTALKALSITVNDKLTITTASPLPGGRTDQSYSKTLEVNGGQEPFIWSGAVPAGLQLGTIDGTITGIPTEYGNFNFAVTVVDVLGATATKEYSITILSPPRVTTISSKVTAAQVTLSGNLDYLGSDSGVSVYFVCGTTHTYGIETFHQARISTGNFTADISGLTKNAVYYYRTVAIGSGITVYGEELSFKAK